MASDTIELMVNSTWGSLSDQSVWSELMKAQRILETMRIACSEEPSVWGWYAVDMSSFVPSSRWTSLQNLETNFESRSLMIAFGRPWNFYTWSRNSLASSFAVTWVVMGTSLTMLVNLSTITQR